MIVNTCTFVIMCYNLITDVAVLTLCKSLILSHRMLCMCTLLLWVCYITPIVRGLRECDDDDDACDDDCYDVRYI